MGENDDGVAVAVRTSSPSTFSGVGMGGDLSRAGAEVAAALDFDGLYEYRL